MNQKFGGQCHHIALYLEEMDNFRPCPGNLEKFTDLLDITIINLKKVNYYEVLNDGLLYMKLQITHNHVSSMSLVDI